MEETIYIIKDNFANCKAKYGDLFTQITWKNIMSKNAIKYIDTGKSYHNSYYFTDKEKAEEFYEKLWTEYHS